MLLTRDVLIDPDSSVDEGKFIVKKTLSVDQSAALINISLFLERGKKGWDVLLLFPFPANRLESSLCVCAESSSDATAQNCHERHQMLTF